MKKIHNFSNIQHKLLICKNNHLNSQMKNKNFNHNLKLIKEVINLINFNQKSRNNNNNIFNPKLRKLFNQMKKFLKFKKEIKKLKIFYYKKK